MNEVDETPLSPKISVFLQELFPEFNFKLVNEQYNKTHFGNGEIEYELGSFHIFIIRDRSQLFIEIALKIRTGTRYYLPRIFEYIGVAKETDFVNHDLPCLTRQLMLFKQNMNKILREFEVQM
jgi:hypothetical protein